MLDIQNVMLKIDFKHFRNKNNIYFNKYYFNK